MNIAAVEINGLTKIFHPTTSIFRLFTRRSHDRDVVALREINLNVQQGEIFGLVGRNGHGKTTLIKSIAALLEPTSGSIKVFGLDTKDQVREARRHIGLVSADERSFYGRLTCWQNLIFYARLYGLSESRIKTRIRDLVEIFDFSKQINCRFHALSTGNKQRLAILRALLIDPPLVLLDEPTRSLDPMAADNLRLQIQQHMNLEQKKTILITSHNLHEIENLCSRVGFLDRGELKLCEHMPDLRAKFLNIERVTLRLRCVRGLNGLSHLRERIPTLEYEYPAQDLIEMRFVRNVEDDLLNVALNTIHASGAQVISCRGNCDGLKEVMMAIERT